MPKFQALSNADPYKKYGVTQPWGNPDPKYAKGYNRGTDFGMFEGTPVHPEYEGDVIRAGENGNWGLSVQVRDKNGYIQQYSHLSDIHVSVGDHVTPADTVGPSGSTGMVTGPHLDYMVLDPQGNDIDPESYDGEQNMGTGDADSGIGMGKPPVAGVGGSAPTAKPPANPTAGTIWNQDLGDGRHQTKEWVTGVYQGKPFGQWENLGSPKETSGATSTETDAQKQQRLAAARASNASAEHAGDSAAASSYNAWLDDQYRRDTDKIKQENIVNDREYNRAIDEGRYQDAQAWKQKIYDNDNAQKALDNQYRKDTLALSTTQTMGVDANGNPTQSAKEFGQTFKLQSDLGYANSRRADIATNLSRQGQAFNQEQVQRDRLAQQAASPSSYLEYAFDSAGVPAPAGTRLAELQGKIQRTPTVEEWLNTQYPGGQPGATATTSPQPTTSPPVAAATPMNVSSSPTPQTPTGIGTAVTGGSPPVAVHPDSIVAQLEANRRAKQGQVAA